MSGTISVAIASFLMFAGLTLPPGYPASGWKDPPPRGAVAWTLLSKDSLSAMPTLPPGAAHRREDIALILDPAPAVAWRRTAWADRIPGYWEMRRVIAAL